MAMRAFVAVLAVVLLCGCGAAREPESRPAPTRNPAQLTALALTPSPTADPLRTPQPTYPPTFTPAPTLAPLQQTAQAVQQQQRASQYATQAAACDQLRAEYAQFGQTFDRASAARDPDRVLIEVRIMHGGSGAPPTSTLGIQDERRIRGIIDTCAGR